MAKYRIIGQGEKWIVIQGDVRDYLEGSLWLRQYEQSFFSFCFSDWPYNLDSILHRFGGKDSAPARFGSDGAFQRQSAGFMGARWDTGLAYDPITWEMILPHLYPGAFTASFTHPRKQHRLAMAQEEAGYILNPAFYNLAAPLQLGWCYSSGKPNGTRIDSAVDRRAGAEREIIGPSKHHSPGRSKVFGGNGIYGMAKIGLIGDGRIETAPASPLAQAWTGHRYGSPLAPELEPVIVAQKPWGPNRLDDILETGAGAVNIEAGKNGMPACGYPGHFVITHHPGCQYKGQKLIKNGSGDVTGEEPSSRAYGKTLHTYAGRFEPTPYQAKGDENGMLAVPDYDCHPDCPARRLDEQTGEEKSYHFYQADWTLDILERLNQTAPVFYSGKVTTQERNAGCESLPKKTRNRVNPGGLEHEPRFAPTLQHNDHPTLKPINLCKWICSLFSPPARYAPRRILIPTCGVGSEMIGALLSGGWDEIIGVELEPRYAEIACARLTWWEEQLRWGQADPRKILAGRARAEAEPDVVQGSLFLPTDFA